LLLILNSSLAIVTDNAVRVFNILYLRSNTPATETATATVTANEFVLYDYENLWSHSKSCQFADNGTIRFIVSSSKLEQSENISNYFVQTTSRSMYRCLIASNDCECVTIDSDELRIKFEKCKTRLLLKLSNLLFYIYILIFVFKTRYCT
jgi:hypothetical protein